MSHARRHIRAFIDDGPHAGETVTVDPDPDGYAPRRITLDNPSRRAGLGDSTELSPDIGDRPGDVVTYELDRADTEVGIWVYRLVDAGKQPGECGGCWG